MGKRKRATEDAAMEKSGEQHSSTVFVSNLPYSVTSSQVWIWTLVMYMALVFEL